MWNPLLPSDSSPYHTLTDTSKTSMTCEQNADFVPFEGGVTSMDSRLMDSARGMRLILDRPPLRTRNVDPLRNMYSYPEKQEVRTGFYDGYQNINGGSIVYYTDIDIAEPYGKPPYTLTSRVIPEMLVDPMGSHRPIYQRIPVYQNNRNEFEYTFDQDQIGFREDLMSLQSRKYNEEAFDTYQLFNNPEEYFPSYQQQHQNQQYK